MFAVHAQSKKSMQLDVIIASYDHMITTYIKDHYSIIASYDHNIISFIIRSLLIKSYYAGSGVLLAKDPRPSS